MVPNNSFNASGMSTAFIDNLDAIPDIYRHVNSDVRLFQQQMKHLIPLSANMI